MHRIILGFFLIHFATGQTSTLTPIEFRGLWSLSKWNNVQQQYAEQLGQGFFYNNGTFAINYLNDMNNPQISYFTSVSKANDGIYKVYAHHVKGFPELVGKTLCYWVRQISNGDIFFGRQWNGTCTASFENDTALEVVRFTRQVVNVTYIDDEDPTQIWSRMPYENELKAFDKSLITMKQDALVFFGSSSFRLWSTLENDFSFTKMPVINRGFGGSTIRQCWRQFKRIILPLEPRILIIYAGENDIAENQTPNATFEVFKQLIPTIRRFFPSLPIAYVSLKPSPSRVSKLSEMNLTNQLIQQEIQKLDKVTYIDVFNQMLAADGTPRPELFIEDKLHMNAQGYVIWTKAVTDYLQSNGLISEGTINCRLSFILFVLCMLACSNYFF